LGFEGKAEGNRRARRRFALIERGGDEGVEGGKLSVTMPWQIWPTQISQPEGRKSFPERAWGAEGGGRRVNS